MKINSRNQRAAYMTSQPLSHGSSSGRKDKWSISHPVFVHPDVFKAGVIE